MIIIPNVPCKHVMDFPVEMEFVLLHKLLDNKFYRDYYIATKDDGKYRILDNGAFELGEGLNDELLLEWAEKINATEIILPDVYGKKDETLKQMLDFLDKHPKCKYKMMVVPQGSDEAEMEACLTLMLGENRVHCIGLNKLWESKLDYAVEIIKSFSNKEIHMLGVNKLSDWNSKLPIRSADSRILSKLVTGVEDPWEEELDKTQLSILKRLVDEVSKW